MLDMPAKHAGHAIVVGISGYAPSMSSYSSAFALYRMSEIVIDLLCKLLCGIEARYLFALFVKAPLAFRWCSLLNLPTLG